VKLRGKLHRIAVPEHMHVHRERLVAQQMIVQGRDLDSGCGKLRHDRIHLVHGQHEIAHDHALFAHFLEGQPTAERKPGLQLDAVERRLQIAARQADAVDAARHLRAGLSERLADASLPAIIGSKGESGSSGEKSRGHQSGEITRRGGAG
jgi:hypothetical protein